MTKFYGVFGSIPKPDKWVFIVGCPSSGTTLLYKLISAHPEVGSMRLEGRYYTDQFKKYIRKVQKNRGYKIRIGGRIWAITPEYFRMDENTFGVDVKKLKRQWGARFDNPTKPILLEKSPPNMLRTRWLQKHFENAYFIGIIRNGYAVAEGSRRRVKDDIRTAAKHWAKANELMLADFEHLERKKLIRYETLVEKPQECIREICEFIGIDPKELSVEGRSVRIRKKDSPIRNMNYRSFERLSEEDYRIIEEEAGDMLKKLGYSRQVLS